MKKIIILLLLIIFSTISFSQQISPTPALSKHDYLKKNKKQRTIVFVLAGGGTITWLAGLNKYMDQRDNKDGGGEAAMIIGGTAALAGIPFFILASKNKKKAMRMLVKIQQVPQLQKIDFVSKAMPTLNLKFSL